MTDQEWVECTDPERMLQFLLGKATERKLRLFAVACCRHILHLLPDKRLHQAIEVAERFADGNATRDQLSASCRAAHLARRLQAKVYGKAAADCANLMALNAAWQAIRYSRLEELTQCHLLRDIFGNPFRPVCLDSATLRWQESTIVKLAQAIYDERAFDRLPILADALEEAGCANADILSHCRWAVPHCRGCWLVDALLAKS
jgi:hypothetical protein